MLNDLRVVEIGDSLAVQVAGLMLASLGADVLKIEPPTGNVSREKASFANWNRGKRSLVLDLKTAEGRAELSLRLANADALIHRLTPTRAAAVGLDDATLAQHFPRLVFAAVTGSPANHPDAERSDDELLVGARLGVMYEYDGHRPGPIVWRYLAGHWAAAHLAAGGVLARLVARLQTGKGGAAHTSIMQGILSNLPLVWGRNSEGPMPNPPVHPFAARPATMQMFRCQDGDWLQIMDPTQQFDYGLLPNMCEVMAEGLNTDTPEGMIEAFSRRPLGAWLADLRACDIAAEPAYPMGAVLRHEEARTNGYVVEVDDPVLGLTIQPNVPFHANVQLPGALPAPKLGEGGEQAWSTKPVLTGDSHADGPPLAGVRVLDFGMFLAGPMGPSLLGDMGANVIKVESLTGDRIRFMHRYYQAASRSKRSLAIDLTRPEAQPIFERLIKWAELIHHNMRMKGAAKLGLTVENCQRINPQAAFNYVSAYGQKGARANWPGYDSIFNAIAGWELENAGEGNRPVFNRPGTMDVITALSCMVELTASLYVLHARGEAVVMQTSLLGLSVLTQGEMLILPDGSLSETFHLTTDQTGFSPYHRIYQTADDQWIAVAAHDDQEQRALRSVLGENEEKFAFAARAMAATNLLRALEKAGAPADTVVFENAMNRFLDDPLNRELGLISVLPQPLYGQVEQPGAFWNFVDRHMKIDQCCPALGQHSDEILREIGYSELEIRGFRKDKIIL